MFDGRNLCREHSRPGIMFFFDEWVSALWCGTKQRLFISQEPKILSDQITAFKADWGRKE